MKSPSISRWIEEFLSTRPVRSNSLLITIYGDLIAPHGGNLWLGSLIRLVEAFGINERLVRTSVYRLSSEKWLISESIRRKSYYSLTTAGRRRFEHAYQRIYHTHPDSWNGEWQIVVIPPTVSGPTRDALRRELTWAGFGQLTSGILAHPSANNENLLDILQESGIHDKVVTMNASTLGSLAGTALQDMVQECWNLQPLADHYKEFVDRFRPVLRTMKAAREPDPQQCFLVQTLLMHDFRRTLLHDPLLPTQLLPAGWAGVVARNLCRDLYRLTWRGAQEYLLSTCVSANGPLPAAEHYFHERFGGLDTSND